LQNERDDKQLQSETKNRKRQQKTSCGESKKEIERITEGHEATKQQASPKLKGETEESGIDL